MTTRSSGSTTWVVILLIAMIAFATAVWMWKSPSAEEVAFQTATVTCGEIVQVVTATGSLNPVVNVTVGSQISGIIQTLSADFNTHVTAGQVIAQLDPATFKANVAVAEGDLANAKATYELTQVDFRRAEELSKAKLISTSEFDKARATLHQAEAQVKIKEAALQRAQVDFSRCTIYSPVDGIVISRNVDVGQTVAASMSAPVLFIIANDLAKMQINAAVSEADIGGIEEGQQVDFTVDAFPYRTFRGKVVQVRNAALTTQNVVTYDAVVEVSNKDLKLKPGMTASVSIVIARRDNSVKIPNAALRFRLPESVANKKTTNAAPVVAQTTGQPRASEGRSGGGNKPRGERSPVRTVHVEGPDGKPLAKQIKVGITDGIMTEVTEGLNEGDVVLTGRSPTKEESKGGTTPSNPFGGSLPRR